mgnify:CR=1 FL=1
MNRAFETGPPPKGPSGIPPLAGQNSVAPSFDEKVNPADLPENDASAPMPDDLPSYAEYMGKVS